jgi:Tfp pilus assembly protein PilX
MTGMMAEFRRQLTGRRRPAGRSPAHGGSQSGIALIIALLLLSLMSVLGIVMMVSVNSDTLINGYYGNYRGSFYAADSGLNIARQQLVNNITTSVSMTPCSSWSTTGATGCTSAPLLTTNAGTILANLKTTYGSFTALNAGQGANSWHEWFEIADNGTCVDNATITQTVPAGTLGTTPVTSFTYQVTYTLCAVGQAQGLQRVTTTETGGFTYTIAANSKVTVDTVESLSNFGAFLGSYPPCLGPLVPGTMSGNMYANGAWQFEPGGSYIFTNQVSQTNADADFWFGSNCIQSPTASYTHNGSTIAPNFEGGFQLGQPTKPLPANDFNQKWAVLDGMGCGEGSNICGSPTSPSPPTITASTLHSYGLTTATGTVYPTSGASSGVYLPYTGHTLSPTAGGIYVEGNAALKLSTGTDASNNPTQIYTITQGSTVTTITINTAGNTTTVQQSGSPAVVLTGYPQNLDVSPAQQGTMIYVNGTITGLAGPAQGVPAIQNNYQTTITANGNVDITGDLIYANERVTLTAADTPTCGTSSTAACDTQELGIFTATGNINLQSPYSNKNLEVDGSLAAISSQCVSLPNSCGFTVTGSINTFNNVGGQIQYNIFSANMNTENTYFDGSVAPPFFPSTTMSAVDITTPLAPTVTTTQQRQSWITSPQ